MGVGEKEIYFEVVEAIVEKLKSAVKEGKNSVLSKFQSTLVSMHLLALKDNPEAIENFIKAKTEYFVTDEGNGFFYGSRNVYP